MAAANFCSTCGSPLTGGVCMTCSATAAQPAGTPSPTPIAPSAASAPMAYQQPQPWGAQGQWNAGAAWGAPPVYGPGSQYIGMWNWGAFLLCPLWLMNHGRVGRGILYIVLSIIPFLGLASFGMAIAYGIKGNEVAATSRYFRDDAQFVAVQNAWRNWGIGVTVVVVVFAILGAIVAGVSSVTHGS